MNETDIRLSTDSTSTENALPNRPTHKYVNVSLVCWVEIDDVIGADDGWQREELDLRTRKRGAKVFVVSVSVKYCTNIHGRCVSAIGSLYGHSPIATDSDW